MISDKFSDRFQTASSCLLNWYYSPLEIYFITVRGYATVIRSLTQGRGSFYIEPSHYDPVPRDIQEKLTIKTTEGKKE